MESLEFYSLHHVHSLMSECDSDAHHPSLLLSTRISVESKNQEIKEPYSPYITARPITHYSTLEEFSVAMCGLKADAAVGDFNVLKDFRNTVDGRLTSSKHTRHGINPADGSAMWEVPVATLQDVDAAVAAGKRAFTSWSQTPYAKRREALVAFADAVELHAQSFAELLTMEQGKPVSF